MNFSDIYSSQLKCKEDNSWLDISTITDIPLFLDPVLIKKYNPEFYGKILSFFQDRFKEIELYFLEDDFVEKEKIKNKTLNALTFPEVNEVALGYSSYYSNGRGSGTDVAKYMFNALLKAYKHKYKAGEYLEGIQLFSLYMGEDRVSDMIATILKEDLIKFTQDICNDNNIPLSTCIIKKSSFRDGVWVDVQTTLPSNLNDKNRKFFILTPKRWLSMLPYTSFERFRQYMKEFKYSYVKRNPLSDDILHSLKKEKEEFADLLLNNKSLFQNLLNYRKNVSHYNEVTDEKNIFLINALLKRYTSSKYNLENIDELLCFATAICREVLSSYEKENNSLKMKIKEYRKLFFDVILILIHNNNSENIVLKNKVDQRFPKQTYLSLVTNGEENKYQFSIQKINSNELLDVQAQIKQNACVSKEFYIYIVDKTVKKELVEDTLSLIKEKSVENIFII